MTSKKPLLGVALAALLVLSTVTAVGAAGSIASEMTGNDLAVAVENVGNDGATVTVTQNGSTVADASVTVDTVVDESYAGTGEYATGENGTVSLPEPETDVVVEVTAAKGDATDSATATITAGESDDQDDAGDEPDEGTFGQVVSSFVHEMLSAGDDGGPLGQTVSEFVTENNPGNADENRPDHAGKPDHAGPGGDEGDDADDENETEVNGTDEDGERGPPDHAGPHDDENETEREDGDDAGEDGDETTDEETDDEAERDEEEDDEKEGDEEEDDEESEEDEDDGSQGPPDHAGNGKGNGNGN